MSILADETVRVIIQGITGRQARVDTESSLHYGTRIVAGVTPGRGGESVCGVPVYNTVKLAVERHGATASVIYVPAATLKEAILEAVDAGIRLIVAVSEGVSRQVGASIVASVRAGGAVLVGPNTTGLISPGKCKLGGIGGLDPGDIYAPGRVGICSRSGGMTAELALMLKQAGHGVSTAVAMGGDRITDRRMVDYLRMFEQDDETDAVLLYGEPGSNNEREVAEHVRRHGLTKPVIALIAGVFQENYPKGMSFGHAAAIIGGDDDSASAKKHMLLQAGIATVSALEEIPALLEAAGSRSDGKRGRAKRRDDRKKSNTV